MEFTTADFTPPDGIELTGGVLPSGAQILICQSERTTQLPYYDVDHQNRGKSYTLEGSPMVRQESLVKEEVVSIGTETL